MARIRTIKPEFFTSEQVVECSPNARLLFVATWVFADDHGRHAMSMRRLQMEAFPGDNFTLADVGRMFGELWQAGLVTVYEVDGKHYFCVNGWHHQKIDKKQDPRHPSPSEGTVVEFCQEFVERSTNGSRTVGDHSAPYRKGRDRKGKDHNIVPSDGTTPPAKSVMADMPPDGEPTYHPAFEQFWAAYPNRGGRKRGKTKTFSVWKSVPAADRQAVVRAATAYAASREASEGFARDPERFLKSDWWRDYLVDVDEASTSRVASDEDLANWNPTDGGIGL